MTKAFSSLEDNCGLCELCDDPKTLHEQQQTFPVLLGGGLGWGTMWLCNECYLKKSNSLKEELKQTQSHLENLKEKLIKSGLNTKTFRQNPLVNVSLTYKTNVGLKTNSYEPVEFRLFEERLKDGSFHSVIEFVSKGDDISEEISKNLPSMVWLIKNIKDNK